MSSENCDIDLNGTPDVKQIATAGCWIPELCFYIYDKTMFRTK